LQILTVKRRLEMVWANFNDRKPQAHFLLQSTVTVNIDGHQLMRDGLLQQMKVSQRLIAFRAVFTIK
jgi:hypothetical protein